MQSKVLDLVLVVAFSLLIAQILAAVGLWYRRRTLVLGEHHYSQHGLTMAANMERLPSPEPFVWVHLDMSGRADNHPIRRSHVIHHNYKTRQKDSPTSKLHAAQVPTLSAGQKAFRLTCHGLKTKGTGKAKRRHAGKASASTSKASEALKYDQSARARGSCRGFQHLYALSSPFACPRHHTTAFLSGVRNDYDASPVGPISSPSPKSIRRACRYSKSLSMAWSSRGRSIFE
jgi:hypothetical protein